MTIRFVRLEEHVADQQLGAAAQPELLRWTPHFADQNIRYRDDPDAPGTLPARWTWAS